MRETRRRTAVRRSFAAVVVRCPHLTAPHESIETSRLVIRRPRPADADAVFTRYASDPAVTTYLSWPVHASLTQTRAFLEFSDREWHKWPAGPYLVFAREDGRLLGGTGLAFERRDRAATGYVFAKTEWGRGYATETLQAMVDVARATGVCRLYAHCHVDHLPSARVLEKCGFTREGILRQSVEFPNLAPGQPADVFCYVRSL
jgi:ribosomal-protein-alanine N-acetyltransferase